MSGRRSNLEEGWPPQQPGGFFHRLPEEMVREFFSREHFSQALPSLPAGTRYADLFEGLTFSQEQSAKTVPL